MAIETSNRTRPAWGVVASIAAGTIGLGALPSCEKESAPAAQKDSSLVLPPAPGAKIAGAVESSPMVLEKLPPPSAEAQAVAGALRTAVTELYKGQDELLRKEKRLLSENEATLSGAKVIMAAFEALCRAQGKEIPTNRAVGQELSAISKVLTESGFTKLSFRRVRTPEGIYIDVELRQLTERIKNAKVETIYTPFIEESVREGVSIFQAPAHLIAGFQRESSVLKIWHRSPGANADNPLEPGKRCIVICPADSIEVAEKSQVSAKYLERFVLANEIGNYVFGERMRKQFSPSDEQKSILGSWNGRFWSAKQYSEAYSDYVALLASPPQAPDVVTGKRRIPRFLYLNALEGKIEDYALSSAVVRSAFKQVESQHLPKEAGRDPMYKGLVKIMDSNSAVEQQVYLLALRQYSAVFEELLGY